MRQGLIALTLVFLIASSAEAKVTGLAYDAVTVPGKTISLSAKFERDWPGPLRPDLQNEIVAFSMGGKILGASRTDKEGKASLSWTAKKEGRLSFKATLVKRQFSVTGVVRVLKPKNKVLVFDIDGTISDMSELMVPFRGHKAKAFPHSVDLLNQLAKDYSIVYLTARDDAFWKVTQGFLRRRQFPEGTVIYNEYGGETRAALGNQLNPKNHGRFKLAVLRQLRRQGLNLVAGIGNAATDAEAYQTAKLRSYIRSEKSYKASFSFLCYKSLRQRLLKDGLITNRSGRLPRRVPKSQKSR